MARKYWMKTKKDRIFRIKDIDCDVIVEFCTRKSLLENISYYIENMENGFYDEDTTYCIRYKDGTVDYIDQDYDGHKIKKINIESIVENNPCTSVVFGNFEINDCGVVTTSSTEIIDEDLIEIDNFEKF